MRQHVIVLVPQRNSGLLDGGGRGQPGIGHQNIEPAKFSRAGIEGGLHLRLIGDITGGGSYDVAPEGCVELSVACFQRVDVAIENHDAGALRKQALGRGQADSARAARDQRNPSRERLWLRQALQFGLLQRPIFNRERLALRQPHIGPDCRGTAYYIDCVAVELARQSRCGSVHSKGEAPDTRQQHHHRIGVAHGRIVASRAPRVVLCVRLPILIQ